MPHRIYHYIIEPVPSKVWLTFTMIFVNIPFIESLDFWLKITGGFSAVIASIFAVISYISKIRLNNQDRKLKKLEYDQRMQDFWNELEKKKANESSTNS